MPGKNISVFLALLSLSGFAFTQEEMKTANRGFESVRQDSEINILGNRPKRNSEYSYASNGRHVLSRTCNCEHSGLFSRRGLTHAGSLLSVLFSQDIRISEHGPAASAKHAVRDTTFKGRYRNYEYGYSVLIPNGLVGFAASPPAPQHGFGVILSRKSKAEIWVDGRYNAALWTSLDAAATTHLNRLAAEGEVEVVKRTSIQLQQLRAIRVITRHIDRESGVPMRQDFVTAIRKHKGEVGIVYEISLTTSELRYEKDKSVFEKLIAGWRLISLP